MANAFFLAATSKYKNKIFNLGSGKPISVNKMVNLIGGKTIFIPERPGEPRNSSANIIKIKKYLKWKPTIKFEDGIKDMLKDLDKWQDAPLWSPKSIKKATKNWFKYIK